MSPKSRLRTSALALSVCVAPVVASATTLTAADIFQQYNVVTKGDFVNRSIDIEGNAFVGGNLTGASVFEFGSADDTPRDDVAELVVQGNVDLDGINPGDNVIRGNNVARDVFIGGTNDAKFEGSATQTTDADLVPDNVIMALDALSTELGGLIANTDATRGTNRLTLNADGAVDGIAVFDLTFDDLNLGEIDTNLGDADLVVINVTGDGNIATNFLGNALGFGQRTIWNFVDATDILLERAFFGQILAGGATVSNNNNIEGTLFANSFVQNGEAHINAFDGELPLISAVPLPAGALLLLSGLGILVAGKRRHNA